MAAPYHDRLNIHIPTPGDHYSPRTGSAVISVIRGLTSQQPAERSRVLVRRDTWADVYPAPEVVRYENAAPRASRNVALAESGLGLFGQPRRRSQAEYGELVALLSELEPATVISHNLPLLSPMIPDRHVNVLYAHNYLWRTYGRPELARSFRNVDAFIGVSDWLSNRLRSRLPNFLKDRVHTVVNGVDTERFYPAKGTREPGPPRILFLGRVIPDKGVDVLVNALTKIAHLDVTTTIVGSSGFSAAAELTAYERSLRDIGASLIASGKLKFTPFVPRHEVPDLLRDADIYVAPSRFQDPCPLGVLEAMASGLAVVGTRVGGIPQLIDRSDLLIRSEDEDGLAQVLEGLISDESNRRGAQTDMRSRALTFSWSTAESRLGAVIQ